MNIYDQFGLGSLHKNNNNYYFKPPEMKDEKIIEESSLDEAIIYLEKKAEQMEEYFSVINISGKTRFEIDKAVNEHNKNVAPYRKAINILKMQK